MFHRQQVYPTGKPTVKSEIIVKICFFYMRKDGSFLGQWRGKSLCLQHILEQIYLPVNKTAVVSVVDAFLCDNSIFNKPTVYCR